MEPHFSTFTAHAPAPREHRHLVHVFSKRRDPGGTSTDYRVTLYEPLKNVVSARLVQAVIPNASRNITALNNRFKFSVLRPEQMALTARFDGASVTVTDGAGDPPILLPGAAYSISVSQDNAGVKLNLTDSNGDYLVFPDEYYADAVSYTHSTSRSGVRLQMFSQGQPVGAAALASSTHMHEVVIPPGMYSSISIISRLSELLQDSGTVAVPDPWSVKYLSAEVGFSISPNLDAFFGAFFDDETPHEVLGFSLGAHHGDVVSDKLPLMGGTLCYKLHVAELINPTHTFAASEPHPFTFVVPVTANMGDVVVADPHQTSHTRTEINPPVMDLKRLSIKLLDDDGAVMDMQGQDHYLCIELVTLSGI